MNITEFYAALRSVILAGSVIPLKSLISSGLISALRLRSKLSFCLPLLTASAGTLS